MNKETNKKQMTAVTLIIALIATGTALLTFITANKAVSGETLINDYRDNASAVITRGNTKSLYSNSIMPAANYENIDINKTIETLIAGFRQDTITSEAWVVMNNPDEVTQITEADGTYSYILTIPLYLFEGNVSNSGQLRAYMINTESTEIYDGTEIYAIRELTIIPENAASQPAGTPGMVSVKLQGRKQLIIMDYRRQSETVPAVTTVPASNTTPASTTTPAATTVPASTTTVATVPSTTTAPATTAAQITTTTAATTAPDDGTETEETEAITTSAPESYTRRETKESVTWEETAPVMGEKAFYDNMR